MMHSKQRIIAFLMLLLWVAIAGTTAFAEVSWYCPKCGQLNHDNYCSADGTKRPDLPEDETPEPEVSGSAVPVFAEMFSGANAHLRLLDDEGERAYSFAGPGKGFADSGGYKPWKQAGITSYFNENGWLFVDIVYATAEERFVYIQKWNFDEPGNVPEIDSLQGYEGTITETTDPSWGPGSKYNTVQIYRASAGSKILVFFQENGYVFGEYSSPRGKARMWFPVDHVDVPGMSLTYTSETSHTGNKSSFGLQSVKAKTPENGIETVDKPAAGEWSDWTDTPISAAAGIEVRTRELYRCKPEIQDWTPWIDGDPPYDSSNTIETRYVEGPEGNLIQQWRSYGYNYHYGEWSEWSEDEYANVGSSWDIRESKTQYSYRIVP